jgi:hypothetical protein
MRATCPAHPILLGWNQERKTDTVENKGRSEEMWLRVETGGGICEQGNEPSGSIQGGEILN